MTSTKQEVAFSKISNHASFELYREEKRRELLYRIRECAGSVLSRDANEMNFLSVFGMYERQGFTPRRRRTGSGYLNGVDSKAIRIMELLWDSEDEILRVLGSMYQWLPGACEGWAKKAHDFGKHLLVEPNRVEELEELKELITERDAIAAAMTGVDLFLELANAFICAKKHISDLPESSKNSKQILQEETKALLLRAMGLANTPYLHLLESVNKIDDELEERLAIVSKLANETLLNEARSLIPADREVPWWLDGRLELIAFAKHLGRRHTELSTFVNEGSRVSFTDLTEKLHSLHEMPVANVKPLGPSSLNRGLWEWELPGPNREVYKVQLLAPIISENRRRVVQMRIVDSEGRPSYSDRRWQRACKDALDVPRSEPFWLVGKIFLLSGVPFRWTVSGKKVSAQVTARVNLSEGPLVLVDCNEFEVLKPFEN